MLIGYDQYKITRSLKPKNIHMHLLPPTHQRTVKIMALRGEEGKSLTTTNPKLRYRKHSHIRSCGFKNFQAEICHFNTQKQVLLCGLLIIYSLAKECIRQYNTKNILLYQTVPVLIQTTKASFYKEKSVIYYCLHGP